MKVLKKGRPQKGWSKEETCTGAGNGGGGCGAKLLVEATALFRTSSSYRDETDYFETFKCPECGVSTDIQGVPSEIRDSLPLRNPGWERRQNDER